MALPFLKAPNNEPGAPGTPRPGKWHLVALAAIVVLAAALRCANLDALGEANHYYTAAVASMLKSWHNFFFVAAEPGGSVSVDKPPVGLWLQAISAYFLGVNGLGVLLPQILAGILSVVLLYHLVRRSFGTAAGLLAALMMAITPIVVATDRNNTMDSTLILTLLLGAWAFSKATESAKLRYLLLGAVLVGIGFNIKMLQAYLPLPAFYALYFLGSAERLWRKVGKLALVSLLLVAISLSWALIVDLTPAEQRPYVGSSGDNSELSLMIGYNGMQRLFGMSAGRGGFAGGGRPAAFPPQGAPGNRTRPFAGGQQGGAGGAFSGTGSPGALRLFIAPLSKEVSWFLPLALVSMLLLLLATRLSWPIARKHQALVLWGDWLLVSSAFFSVASFFHEYYLSMLAPPVACLAAIGLVELWRRRERQPWLSVGLLLVVVGGTLAFQVRTAQAFVRNIGWLPPTLALFALGSVLLVVTAAAGRKLHSVAVAGFALLVAAVLVTPGIWSALTNLNASANQSLPSAYAGRLSGPANGGRAQVNQSLLEYLETHTQGTKYLMAVPSSMQGADYVLATGRPVLYLGGFMGMDHVVTADELQQMVCQGELRYVYWDTRGRGMGNQADISSWVASTCTAVTGYETATVNAGPPDGTGAGRLGGFQGPGGMMQISLYDCGCHATAQVEGPGESTP